MSPFVIIVLRVIYSLSLITAMIVSIIHRDKKHLSPIRYYLIFCVCNNLITLAFTLFHFSWWDKPARNESYNLYTIGSVGFIYWYFRELLTTDYLRKITVALYTFLIFICLYFWLGTRHTVNDFFPSIIGIAATFATIPCFFYFYELLTSDLVINFKTNDNLYITCAIVLTFGIAMPFYFGYQSLYMVTPNLTRTLYGINELLFIFHFITITYAFLIKSRKPESIFDSSAK